MPRLTRLVLAGACAAGLALTACQPATVRVAFRPPVGARYRYEVRVRSVTVTRLGDTAPDTAVDEAVLRADHTVLAPAAGEVRVRVQLNQDDAPTRTFVVRFDRAAQLAGVETVEGLPASVLGPLALPDIEIFPAAAAAPPNRPLSPGERWKIDAHPRLEGATGAVLQGSGRLVELGVVNGRRLASISAETRLPVKRTTQVAGGTQSLQGEEITDITARRALADGAVEQATSVTRGTFQVTLTPPAGGVGPPLTGTLSVEVRSETRRLR